MLYIVEVKKINNETQLYLTEKETLYARYRDKQIRYLLFGTDILLSSNSDEYNCDYGEVINIIPFKQFISSYIELKETYTAEEIMNVFESIKKDYNDLIKKDDIKKLELK